MASMEWNMRRRAISTVTRAEQQDSGGEPEDGRDGNGQPCVDGVVVDVEAGGGLGDGEDADQPGEEEEDSAESEE